MAEVSPVLRSLLALSCAAIALTGASARADLTKNQCVDANSSGQALRLDGKLEAARHDLQLCADPSCPAILRVDCGQRLDELERAQPTIVFDTRDASGSDLSAVRVTIDGRPFVDRLEGTALRADPGEHTFTFSVPGYPAVARTFVLREGEKARRERIVIGSPSEAPVTPMSGIPSAADPSRPSPAAASTSTASSIATPSNEMGAQKIVGLTAAGLGVVGLTLGSIFGLLTFAAASAEKSDCASPTSCANHNLAANDHSSGVTDGAISTVGFVAGGALLVAGATLFFTAPSRRAGGASTSLAVVPTVARDSAGMVLRGEF